jgi:hypothetical protein
MYTISDNDTDTHIYFNSDMSGDLRINVLAERAEPTVHGRTTFLVPGELVLRLVAQHVANKRISDIEQMEWPEVLGLNNK